MQSPLICSLICAICTNLIAEVMLAHSLHQPWARLSATQRHVRQLRWVLCSTGCLVLGIQQISIGQQIVFGLFSVSAATDFETKLLPPDWYLYGSVIIGIAISGVVNGWAGVQQAILTQAFCFGVVTVGVAFFNLCDSGDIKLAMQFGCACGSLAHVLQAATVVWVIAGLVILVVAAAHVRRSGIRRSLRTAISLQPPQGPLLWYGLLAVIGGFW